MLKTAEQIADLSRRVTQLETYQHSLKNLVNGVGDSWVEVHTNAAAINFVSDVTDFARVVENELFDARAELNDTLVAHGHTGEPHALRDRAFADIRDAVVAARRKYNIGDDGVTEATRRALDYWLQYADEAGE